MKEKELEDAVIDCLHRSGWMVAHFSPAPMHTRGGVVWRTPFKADGKGFPDLVAVRERLLVAELKISGNPLTKEQREWEDWLDRANVEHWVWTEKEWFSGEIEEVVR